MCVRAIIDASAFRHLMEPTPKTAGAMFRKWIKNRNGLVVHAKEAQYDNELRNYPDALRLLKGYRQDGLVENIDTELVKKRKDRIPDHPIRRSNDLHILALAAASEATVLFSCDSNLQKDFANTGILANAGRTRRRSVPLRSNHPEDITDAAKRMDFLNRRKCKTRQ